MFHMFVSPCVPPSVCSFYLFFFSVDFPSRCIAVRLFVHTFTFSIRYDFITVIVLTFQCPYLFISFMAYFHSFISFAYHYCCISFHFHFLSIAVHLILFSSLFAFPSRCMSLSFVSFIFTCHSICFSFLSYYHYFHHFAFPLLYIFSFLYVYIPLIDNTVYFPYRCVLPR